MKLNRAGQPSTVITEYHKQRAKDAGIITTGTGRDPIAEAEQRGYNRGMVDAGIMTKQYEEAQEGIEQGWGIHNLGYEQGKRMERERCLAAVTLATVGEQSWNSEYWCGFKDACDEITRRVTEDQETP